MCDVFREIQQRLCGEEKFLFSCNVYLCNTVGKFLLQRLSSEMMFECVLAPKLKRPHISRYLTNEMTLHNGKITNFSGSTPVHHPSAVNSCKNSYKPHMLRNYSSLATFLQRVSIACYAERCINSSKSVRLSVCLSHAGTVSKRLKLRSWGLHWRIAP